MTALERKASVNFRWRQLPQTFVGNHERLAIDKEPNVSKQVRPALFLPHSLCHVSCNLNSRTKCASRGRVLCSTLSESEPQISRLVCHFKAPINSILQPNQTHPCAYVQGSMSRSYAISNGVPGASTASQSAYVTLVSSDGFEFHIRRSAACISGTIRRMLDPSSKATFTVHSRFPHSLTIRRQLQRSLVRRMSPRRNQWHGARESRRIFLLQRET